MTALDTAEEATWLSHGRFSAVLDRSVDLLRVSSALCTRCLPAPRA
ncbi:hypothetical protein [Streptomyces fuscigenes]|nr:hypothetical protein [Streptomyces fuscigenes]MCF3963757.1 hypothetical protein [Streptomyces fuscigenes]